MLRHLHLTSTIILGFVATSTYLLCSADALTQGTLFLLR